MKKLLAAAVSLLCMGAFSVPAYAAVNNPLSEKGMGIRLLEDFSGYAGLEQLYGGNIPDGAEQSVFLEGQSLLLTLNGQWFDTQLPIRGFAQRPASGFEPGVLAGAEGIGLYIDTREPLGITEFTPSIIAQADGLGRHFNMAPESRYYLVSDDGVTYEGTSRDTGWGEGIIDGIGINFTGMLLVPFESYKYNGRSFSPQDQIAQKLQLKGFSGDVRVNAVFIYGRGVQEENAEEIRSFFISPENVEIPQNYEITKRIQDVFGLKSQNNSGGGWLAAAIAAGGVLLLGASALIFRICRKKKGGKSHE